MKKKRLNNEQFIRNKNETIGRWRGAKENEKVDLKYKYKWIMNVHD